MVNIANSSAKLISTTVNEKSGTTIKKFLMPEYGRKAMATVVEYGENNPLKKKGIDSFVKITGAPYACGATADKALFSGDKIILSGASEKKNFEYVGDFNSRFKEMIDLLKKYPKLTAALIPNTKTLNPTYGYTEAMEKFQK